MNSGSEANDLAMQMAYFHTKKRKVVCLNNAYHGITKACMDISPYKWTEHYKKPEHVIVAEVPDSYRGIMRGKEDPVKSYC